MREAGTAPAERVPMVVRFERVVMAFWEAPVTVAAEPVTEPVIAFVTVRSVKKPLERRAPVAPRAPVEVMLFEPIARVPPRVREERVPTEVSDEARTFEARVAPVRVPAGAVPVMLPVTLPVRAPKKLVAVIDGLYREVVEVALVEVELPLMIKPALMVEEAFEIKPLKRPRVVVVETPHDWEVKGKA